MILAAMIHGQMCAAAALQYINLELLRRNIMERAGIQAFRGEKEGLYLRRRQKRAFGRKGQRGIKSI